MLENLTSVSLVALMVITGPVLLGVALAFAIWRTKRRSRAEKVRSEMAAASLIKEGD
jgi:ABC-type spermidine/putrescine transport system permease subunit II